MAEVFKKIIDTTKPPYNIAVIGKWGLGKSSLIRLVTEECKKKGAEYLVQEINAWKYERESLRKVFLKQLWQELSGQKIKSFEIIRKEYERIIYNDFDEFNQEPKKKWWERIKICFFSMLPTMGVMALIFVITYLAMIVYKCVQFNLDGRIFAEYFWTLEFWRKVFLSYCQNVATIWIIPLLVTFGKKALDDYRAKKAKKIELNFPLESVDDYEIFLETKIQEKMQQHENLKVITVIDDLDRLSIEKIVEALDALKAFVSFERCIFIVPSTAACL